MTTTTHRASRRAGWRRLLSPWTLAALLVVATPPLAGWLTRAQVDACERTEAPKVVVNTRDKELLLCRQRQVDGRFPVALGRNGVGKSKEGDGRTPIGRYPLAPARPSVAGLHRFLHIGYPTRAQRDAGLTGSAIGIHGPPRSFARTGVPFALLGFTDGCVALSSDAEVDAVAEWVDTWGAREVEIRL